MNPYKLPSFFNEYDAACAIDAGAAIVTHYDIQYEELIPDYSVANKWGVWMYQNK